MQKIKSSEIKHSIEFGCAIFLLSSIEIQLDWFWLTMLGECP